MEHSLTKFVKETQPSLNIIDYIIRTKHKFLLIINHERNAKVLLDISNYAGISEDNGIYYIHSKKPILINNQYPEEGFNQAIMEFRSRANKEYTHEY